MKILIDNGHGIFTPGKRSPNGEFREAIYTREIARRIVADLFVPEAKLRSIHQTIVEAKPSICFDILRRHTKKRPPTGSR